MRILILRVGCNAGLWVKLRRVVVLFVNFNYALMCALEIIKTQLLDFVLKLEGSNTSLSVQTLLAVTSFISLANVCSLTTGVI
jgi:hypothetical protein